ncbi:MAG: aminotransferase [Pseudomonadota bacterium]
MMMSRTQATFSPPIMGASRWLDGLTFPPERPLINVCQAAPLAPPPEALREVMADAVMADVSAHFYGADLGRPALRAALAAKWRRAYGGAVREAQVAITSGCNQAFAAAIMALTGQGDEVILPTPWYFNHKMWLDMCDVRARAVPTGEDLLPDPEAVRALITPRTRALAIVSPNNPAGVEYPATLLSALFEICREARIKLILDETYRDFHSAPGAPHNLFLDPDWDDTLIQLYSFSKAYRLTGHRVGALTASPGFLSEVEKFIDTVTICPSQIGQIAALWGLENLDQWLAGEREEILDRRAAITDGLTQIADRGWSLLGLGAYFAYMRHPFERPADEVAPWLVREHGVLLLPATMFRPDGDPRGARELRIAFANLDRAGIGRLYDRLAEIPT